MKQLTRSQAQSIEKNIKAFKTKMSDDIKGKKDGRESSTWKDVGWFALKTTVISGAVLGGTAIALPAIGFTAGGVAAGSLAASFQSAYLGGTIASGSAFALLQSAGAAGLAASTQAGVVALSAAISGAHSVFTKSTKKNKSDSESDTSEEPSESKEDVDEGAMEKNDDMEVQGKINPNNDLKGPKVSSTRKDKKFPVKSPKNEDEMDSLRKKWEDVELSKDITITQHLVKRLK